MDENTWALQIFNARLVPEVPAPVLIAGTGFATLAKLSGNDFLSCFDWSRLFYGLRINAALEPHLN